MKTAYTTYINDHGTSPHLEQSDALLRAQWPAPERVRTLVSTRMGGVSVAPYDSLNVGMHVGDDPHCVIQNRAIIQQHIDVPVVYLNQVHGVEVVSAQMAWDQNIAADASVDCSGTVACAVMTADCLPVLLCDTAGTVVAAAHAGWRGLLGGVIDNTVKAMNKPGQHLMAWLGPAIGAEAFEVGESVYEAFCQRHAEAKAAFVPIGTGQYLADIYALARMALLRLGVHHVYGGIHCTVLDRDRFFSYRRDGQHTGRMISAIWLSSPM